MAKRKYRDSDVTVTDALGTQWHVKEARPTKYGFDLLYGKKKHPGPYDFGGPTRLIYTKELKAFWEKNALRLDGTLSDLPAGRTTLKRARLALGFNWDDDSKKFWRKHKADMIRLTPREFAEKYKEQEVTKDRVNHWRLRLCGAKARPFGWWRKPKVLKLLLSEKSLNQVRAELEEEISTSHVFRLRRLAKRAFEIRKGKLIQITDGRKDRQP